MQSMCGSWRTFPLLIALLATAHRCGVRSGPLTPPSAAVLLASRIGTQHPGLCHSHPGPWRTRWLKGLERRQADKAMAIALQELGISAAVLANPQVRKAAAMLENNLDEACQLTGLDATAGQTGQRGTLNPELRPAG